MFSHYKSPNNCKNGRVCGNPSLKCEALIWPFIDILLWLLIIILWKIYGKSIHLLNVQWIGRIGFYGFCSNLDCNGLIRNYRIFGGVGSVALLYYVVALVNFRRTKEIDTQQDIYVLKAVLNLWENCTDQNCFLFKGLIFYVQIGE